MVPAWKSHHHIIYESRCQTRYILHCPISLVIFLEEELHSPQDDNEDESLVMILSDLILTWLIRTNKTVAVRQVNTLSSRTHKCTANSISSNKAIEQISQTIIEAATSASLTHFIDTDYPEHANPCLEIYCLPTFERQECSNKHLLRCSEYMIEQSKFCHLPFSSLIMSWMVRTNCRFLVQSPIPTGEEGPRFMFLPSTIFPLIDLFVDKVRVFIDENDKPTQQQTNPANPTNIESISPQLVTPVSTKKRKQTTVNKSLFHPYSTRTRTTQISQLLQSASRSKIKIKYHIRGMTTERHMPGQPPILLPL